MGQNDLSCPGFQNKVDCQCVSVAQDARRRRYLYPRNLAGKQSLLPLDCPKPAVKEN
jgi:hypothetical protein